MDKKKKADINSVDSKLWDFSLLKERVLNAVNKDQHSRTFGCCDRLYWGWKLKDFPDLTKQYSLYAFSMLMDEESAYEIEIFRGMLLFWSRFLNRDGSADQCFPREMSSGPTLYVLNAVLLSYGKILRFFKKDEIESLNKRIKNSLDFSIKYPEKYGYIANHRALFAHTYLMAYQIFNHDSYHKEYEKELEGIHSHLQEGWFLEYETADPGYQTQCLHYLTLCFQITRDKKLKEIILDSIEKFISYFIFPDGSFSGTFSGRATEILYPYPFMYWRHESELCNEIINFLYRIKKGKTLIKWCYLDYENFIRLGPNYLLSHDHYRQIKPVNSVNALPCFKVFKKEWKKAGLMAISDQHKYMVINFKRGGIFKAVGKKNDNLIEDTGYIIKTSKSIYASSFFNPYLWHKRIGENSFNIKTGFHKTLENYLDVIKMIVLRLLSLFKFRLVSELLKKRMVDILMLRKKPIPISLDRTIIDEANVVKITDVVQRTKAGKLRRCSCYTSARTIPFHMASAGYYHQGKRQNVDSYDISGIEMRHSLELHTKITFTDAEISISRVVK